MARSSASYLVSLFVIVLIDVVELTIIIARVRHKSLTAYTTPADSHLL